MKSSITSRELLTEVGASTEEEPEFPPCYRHLLITSVITFVSARKFQQALNKRGDDVSLRDVLEWQRAMREWLGLPEAGRGKPSDEYRNEVRTWLHENGNPTPEQIDAGWVPAHRRDNKAWQLPKLSPKYQQMMDEHRVQVAKLNATTDDDEVRFLMSRFLNRGNQTELVHKKSAGDPDGLLSRKEELVAQKVGQDPGFGKDAGA
jgi:hypothetical protein